MVVHKLYYNAEKVLKRSWVSAAEISDPRLRSSTYIACYSYAAIMLFGLAGMVRFRRLRQLAVVAPVVGYIVLLIALTEFSVKYRIYFEPILILYTAVVLVRLGDMFRLKVRSAIARRSKAPDRR